MLPTKFLISPWALGKAFAMPFIAVVGISALIVWGLCLFIGADAFAMTSGYFGKALVETLPIVHALVSIWLIYFFALYAPVAYTTSNSFLNTIGRAVKPAILAFIYRLVSHQNVYAWGILGLDPSESPINPIQAGSPDHLSTGWLAGIDPHRE